MFRTGFLFLLIALAGLFLQSVMRGDLISVVPDVVLVLVVIVALLYPSVPGLLSCFGLGLLADFATARYLGPNAAGCVVAFALAVTVSTKIYADRVVGVAMIAFVCSIAKALTLLAMLAAFLNTIQPQVFAARTIFFEGLLTALLAPPIVWMLGVGRSFGKTVKS